MPLFEVQGPDGSTYEVDAPDERAAFGAFQRLTAPQDATAKVAAGIGMKPAGEAAPPSISNYQPTPEEFAADDAAIAARNNPQPQSLGQRAFRTVDDAVRSIASGATFGLADELAAGANSIFGDKSYAENLAAERARDKEISPFVKIPGEIAGGLATGLGAGRAGLTLMNAARPTIANMALRGAGEGAVYGAAHGFGHGEGGLENRAVEAGKGAALGALTGGATGAAAGGIAARGARAANTTPQELRAQSDAAYGAAHAAGLQVRQQPFANAVENIAQAARADGLDPTLHPAASQALNRLAQASGGAPTLREIDTLRQVLGDAAASRVPGESRIARQMMDHLDDFVENLRPADVQAGDPMRAVPLINQARNLWSRFRKSEEIGELFRRAEIRASGQFSGSGYENALRTEFRQLAMNPQRMRRFTPAERQAIERVARGGPAENVLRAFGRFAPRGVVSGGFHLGVGAAGGPVAGGATMLAAEAARRGATALTHRNADMAYQLMLRGGPAPAPGPLTPVQQAIVQSLIYGGAQQGPGALDTARNRGLPALRGLLE